MNAQRSLRGLGRAFFFTAFTACVSACAPQRGEAYEKSLASAQRANHAGRYEEAAASFDEAAKTAKVARDGVYARYLAATARARAGDVARAATEFRTLADANPPNDYSAEAAYQVALLTLANDAARGEAELDAVVLRFPRHAVARLAVGRLLRRDVDAGGPEKALARLDRFAGEVKPSDPKKPGVEEKIAYERARTLLRLERTAAARDAFVDVSTRWPYPHGVYFDDALFRASELDEKLGEPQKAIEHLEDLVARRESSVVIGSYERPRYTPAMLRIADIYETKLHDREKARATLRRFYKDFTRSVMRDDALWHEAELWKKDGDERTACSRLETLVDEFPDSRYVPCASLRCPSIARPKESKAPKECRSYIDRGYWAGGLRESQEGQEEPEAAPDASPASTGAASTNESGSAP